MSTPFARVPFSGYPFKRTFDLVVGTLLFIVMLPIMLAVGLLILCLDGRPIIFQQVRTGHLDKSFVIYKFRSMEIVNGELTHVYTWNGNVPEDFVYKIPSNQKLTKIGAFLRKYSLDELPQLINVLKGDMSLVGPRPEIPNISRFYDDEQKKRLWVKPGLTGLAQIQGRSNINHGMKIEYDLQYVEHCCFSLDMWILCKTVLKVFTGKGAY